MRERSGILYLTDLPCQGARRSITGNLVMFDFLRGGNQGKVCRERFLFLAFINGFRSFLNQAHHGLTWLWLRLLSQELEDFLQSFDMGFDLLQMLDERLLQFRVVGSIGHFG